jgi:hypothetical protein
VRVLVVTNLYPPNAVGGYERLCALVASGLSKRGHTLSVLTSDYGTLRLGREELPVERSLRILASPESIYQPFVGSAVERAAINEHNLCCIARKLEAEKPDAVLVGNLHFFDASILRALAPVADRIVYLLTDVWMIHFADDASLQDYFRRAVIEIEHGAMPLVPPDPPALVLDRIDSAEALVERAAMLAFEVRRRRRLEAELAAGRAVFQKSGFCHLCGPTTFLVRRAGPATLTLPPRFRTEVTCTSCTLDGTVRGALHALDVLASPDGVADILLAVADPGARQFLQKRYPQCRTVVSVADLASHTPRGGLLYRHAVCVERAADASDVARKLRLLSESVVADGMLVLCDGFAPVRTAALELEGAEEALEVAQATDSVDVPAWDLLEQAREAGLADAAAYSYWSDQYGYFGRDYLLYVARIEASELTR